jgi:hypothetical protein
VNTSTPTPAETGVPVTGPSATPIIIQHRAVPGELPASRLRHTGDYDSSVTEAERRAPGGDRFILGQYERPFNTETMDIYYPDLDLQEMSIYKDDIWIYARIAVKGRDTDEAFHGNYALELDLDIDGAGDLLILARRPSWSAWTSLGVQIWSDENQDVGGRLPTKAEAGLNGDGFERLIFDQGRASNPDLAWVRVATDETSSVEIAFMELLLLGDRRYAVGAWAGYDDLQPGLFDLNDHFTQAEAGEAMTELEQYYPIKELSGLDSTCRVAIGFLPQGTEPGLCSSLVPTP